MLTVVITCSGAATLMLCRPLPQNCSPRKLNHKADRARVGSQPAAHSSLPDPGSTVSCCGPAFTLRIASTVVLSSCVCYSNWKCWTRPSDKGFLLVWTAEQDLGLFSLQGYSDGSFMNLLV